MVGKAAALGALIGTAAAWQGRPMAAPAGPPRARLEAPAIVEATAYCSCARCCGRWARYGLTASGHAPREGVTVAADPRVYPIGTCLVIQGLGVRIVQDTGSAIRGSAVDVYLADHGRARAFGRRRLQAQRCSGVSVMPVYPSALLGRRSDPSAAGSAALARD